MKEKLLLHIEELKKQKEKHLLDGQYFEVQKIDSEIKNLQKLVGEL